MGIQESAHSRATEWLPHKDSNLNKQIQNLRCYHYTMRQLVQNGAYYTIDGALAQVGVEENGKNVFVKVNATALGAFTLTRFIRGKGSQIF